MALVTWTTQALADLDAVCLFIARDFPDAAIVLARRAFEATARLESFPRSGRVVPELGKDDIRELIIGNHRIIYRLTSEDEVVVLTIHHGARRTRDLNLS